MINRLQLLRNVGPFDSVNSGATIPIPKAVSFKPVD
jgi:hypothetical protein